MANDRDPTGIADDAIKGSKELDPSSLDFPQKRAALYARLTSDVANKPWALAADAHKSAPYKLAK